MKNEGNYSANNIKECPIGQKSYKSVQIKHNYLIDLFRFERFGYAELKVLAKGDSFSDSLNSYE